MTNTDITGISPGRLRGLMRRPAAALVTAASVAGVLTGLAIASAAPASAATIASHVSAAHSYGNSHGVTNSVAVLDTSTGAFYGAGSYATTQGSASVVKLLIATELCATGQINCTRRYAGAGGLEGTAHDMIVRSNDALPNSLSSSRLAYDVRYTVSRYRLYGLIALSRSSWCWGNTQISAKGIVYFYRAMMHDSKVAPWLVDAIHHFQGSAADGTNQTFGLPSASSGGGYKQGWGHCSSNTGGSVINTTGLLSGNRYAVAILTNTNNWSTNSNSYNATQARVATGIARTLLPYGHF